ncbi:MAG TPA: hypothetical protein VEJ87_06350 [Acidimicrobiales bacterium]|nr:hypothetical protein [Acidimicrobiales bacterium]
MFAEPRGVPGGIRRIRDELRRGYRFRKSLGLALLAVGAILACAGGVLVAQYLYGDHTGTTALVLGGLALLSGVAGNLIWQKARIASRRSGP